MKKMLAKQRNKVGMIQPIAILFLILGSVIISCDDIFEKDLDGEEVNIYSPSNELKTQYNSQNFWWEKKEGALYYNFQIVSPSFDQIEKLLIDTNIAGTKFIYTLYPGKFQWRLRPANGSSFGKYVIRTLEIDTTLDLRGQEVILRSPGVDFATNRGSIKFSWDKLYNASDFRFEIKNGGWDGSRYINPVLTQYDTITIGNFAEGTYYWGVQAQNNGSATVFSNRKFLIDRTEPKTPILSEPKDSTKTDGWPATFKWTNTPDGGAAIYDSLVIATDKNFKNSSIKFSQKITNQSQQVNLNATGKYYWKVITVDAAGNMSSWSETYLLIIGSN